MPFDRQQVAELLVQCHRRCCICHRFCGIKIETDHIEESAAGGSDDISNAIPVCFDCHAEIHSYNDKHPRGRKFTADELRGHKEQWLRICANTPAVLLAAARDGDVGPLQALVDELEYNVAVVELSKQFRGAIFHDAQFLRAIQEGMIAILAEPLKQALVKAYAAISRANQHILSEVHQDVKGRYQGAAALDSQKSIAEARDRIETARSQLLQFLGSR
jgi:hypothetical protein